MHYSACSVFSVVKNVFSVLPGNYEIGHNLNETINTVTERSRRTAFDGHTGLLRVTSEMTGDRIILQILKSRKS